MRTQETLSLRYGFELPHTPLAHPGALMRLLRSIVGILRRIVNSFGNQFPVGDAIASQFVGNNLPGCTAMASEKALEEALRRSTIPAGLEKNINDFAILIHCTPQIVLLAVDLYEDFIDEECVAVTLVLPLQSSSI